MIFRLLYSLFFITCCFSCAKEQGADPATLYTNPEFIVKFNNGESIQYQQTINSVKVIANSQYNGVENFETCSFIKEDSRVNESFIISLSKVFYSTPSQYQTDSLFSLGYYRNFGQSTTHEVGVTIEHTDADGITWTTYNGGQQIGSFLRITNSQITTGPGFRYKVSGTFSCTLYSSPSYSKVYNGEFVGKFGVGNY